MPVRTYRIGLVAALLVLIYGAVLSLSTAPALLPSFRIATTEPGVYRVSYEALIEAGLPPQPVASPRPSLFNHGKPVRLWISDGADGSFGPGDWFEFVAERLAGEYKYFHEYTRHNIYTLSWNETAAARMSSVPAPSATLDSSANRFSRITRTQHMEHDQLLIRLSSQNIGQNIGQGIGQDIGNKRVCPTFYTDTRHF